MYQRFRKILVCGGLIATLLIPSAAAATISEPVLEIENQVLGIEGNLVDAKPYANVSVEVYYPGCGPDSVDITAEDYVLQMKKAIYWMGQVNLSGERTYELNLDMNDAPPGEYLVRLYADGATEPVETSIYYSSPKQQQFLIEQVTSAETSDALGKLLDIGEEESTFVKTFRLTDSLYFSANPDNVAVLLYEYNQNYPIDETDSERFKEILLLCSLADNLSMGNKFDIMKYTNLFVPDEDFVDTYNDRLNDSVKNTFTQTFKGLSLKNEEDIKKAYSQQTFLTAVNNIQNWSDIKYVIKTHGDDAYIALDMDSYEDCKDKEELCVELAKDAPYSSIEDFKDNLKIEAKKIKSDSKGNSSGSSGGGGGGSKISMTTTPVLPEIPADEFVFQEAEKITFNDLDSALWAKESIEYLAEKNIVSGVDSHTFEPDREIKREEFIKMLVCAFSDISPDAKCTFADVPEGSWFYAYAATAEQIGVLKGYDNGCMGAGEYLTREDIATLAYRMATQSGINLPAEYAETFPDDSLIANYARDAVYVMKSAGIINGMGDGTFAPKQHCTRAQAAKIIYGLIK